MIRKINPKILSGDICQLSLTWLENYAKNWFNKHVPDHGQIWFSDENTKVISVNFPNKDELVEIILTGNFFLRMLESKFWTFEQFRLWTFSSRLKDFLVQTYKIPSEKIGIIGRTSPSEIFHNPNFSESANFVYAGRLSLAKNITSIIRLTSLLQTKYDRPFTLDIFGEPDDFTDPSIGRYQTSPIVDVINGLIEELPWKERPVFHGSVAQSEWLKVNRAKPVFVSFSCSMYEDFGTAAEIAIQHGWPCLLSDWGGHAEAGNSIKVPLHLVARTHEPLFLQKFKSEALASVLIKNSLSLSQKAEYNFVPEIMSRNELNSNMDIFFEKWGPEVLLCLRASTDFFADTRKGINFFRQYSAAFGPHEAEEALIINDLRPNTDHQIKWEGKSFEVIYLREFFNSFFLKRLENYKTITLVELGPDIPVIQNYIKDILGLNIPINILSDSDQ
jgi:hypothetical protein